MLCDMDGPECRRSWFERLLLSERCLYPLASSPTRGKPAPCRLLQLVLCETLNPDVQSAALRSNDHACSSGISPLPTS